MYKLKDIVQNKNFPLIETRNIISYPDNTEADEHDGYCSYINSELKALDFGNYSLDDEYIKYEEFDMPTKMTILGQKYNAGTKCLIIWQQSDE